MLQAQRSSVSMEEGAPVGDVILSRLYRAKSDEIASIVKTLPVDVRARLAAFCYARAHLRTIGREIAAQCDESSLRQHAGVALGRSIIEARRLRELETSGVENSRGRANVSLATAADMRRKETVTDDAEDLEESGV